MASYLYGLVLDHNAHLVPAHITGLGSTVLRVVECKGLGALVSTLERAPARNLDDVRAHDHALQSVVHHGATAAAVRFGQTFASDDDVRTHVAERGERIARVLQDCDGCVEMRLLLAHVPNEHQAKLAPDRELGPGRAYLEGLRGSTERLKSLGLHEAFGSVVRAERLEELPKNRGVVFSHLIRRTDEVEYREAVSSFPALAEARIVGPLALYSFAEPAE
ncbi:MAG: GvpL/GvpF family gas vesicle protein [Gemmatimonadaceae bacterium]